MSFSLERKPEPELCEVCFGSKVHQCEACRGSGNVICIGCLGKLVPQACLICSGMKRLRCRLCNDGLVSCGVCGGTGQRW